MLELLSVVVVLLGSGVSSVCFSTQLSEANIGQIETKPKTSHACTQVSLAPVAKKESLGNFAIN